MLYQQSRQASYYKKPRKIDSELKGESKRFGNAKESVTVGRRKPVVEGVLEHLKSPSTTNYNIMIDAETGFGKTYDIGLHGYVLAQAGFHHLVAVPNNNLVNQAKKMIGDAFSLRIETPETTQVIKDLLKNTKPVTIIITHDLLLQQKDGQKLGNRSDKKPKLWSVLMKQTVLANNRLLKICVSLIESILQPISLQLQKEES